MEGDVEALGGRAEGGPRRKATGKGGRKGVREEAG